MKGISENRYYKKKKKKKKKKSKGLGWGNSNYYGAAPLGGSEGFSGGDGGGMGENILRFYIREILKEEIQNSDYVT